MCCCRITTGYNILCMMEGVRDGVHGCPYNLCQTMKRGWVTNLSLCEDRKESSPGRRWESGQRTACWELSDSEYWTAERMMDTMDVEVLGIFKGDSCENNGKVNVWDHKNFPPKIQCLLSEVLYTHKELKRKPQHFILCLHLSMARC